MVWEKLRPAAAVEYLFAVSDDLSRSVFLFIGEWASESGILRCSRLIEKLLKYSKSVYKADLNKIFERQ